MLVSNEKRENVEVGGLSHSPLPLFTLADALVGDVL